MRASTKPLPGLRTTFYKINAYHKTSVQFPEQVFLKTNLTSSCLGYWIVYRLNDVMVTSNCLRSRPHWMHESRSSIGNLTLLDLMIPGTHNAGCFSPYNSQEDTLFTRYLFTQILTNLHVSDLPESEKHNFGIMSVCEHDNSKTIRATGMKFDRAYITNILKLAIHDSTARFHLAQRPVCFPPIQVNRFRFQRRTASTRRRHRDLIALLERELGEFMVPVHYTSGATLEQLWNDDKRLYVGYADERARTRSLHLFPAVKHLWGDVDQAGDLWHYPNETVCNPSRRRLTSAMAQLTPTKAGALFNLYGGLRKMAEQVNRQVTRWFSYDWNHCANIVATDFFLGNNIIELAIETNKRRLPPEDLL
ncbi:hypothetical protein AVEN_18360-1 [Araneus ventricosus]|uniref:Uncharacterized protein n=1 Tax=Araneus ventricosus TaxID=182803 RepID=A0A4Y2HQ29_ARAVE|nr:hypothetical protein AVEN_18360-1 [Araneus ventricosus]